MSADGAKGERYRTLLAPLLVGLAATLLGTAIAFLSSEVLEGETLSFDLAILHRCHLLRSAHPWLSKVMRDLSGLGSVTVIALAACATAGYLFLIERRTTGVLVALSILTGSFANAIYKTAFGRSRPDAAFAEFTVPSVSFPSGHASMSAIAFLTLGALLASTRSRTVERGYILAIAAVLTLLVGVSRVALGVHWATDVLGGWAFGTTWAIGWLLLARWLVSRSSTTSPPRP